LALDKEYTQQTRVPPLFSYFLAKPKKSVLLDDKKLNEYQNIENLREDKARKRHGVYSDGQYVVMMLHHLWYERLKGAKHRVRALLEKIPMR
jgi:hypothetical protein